MSALGFLLEGYAVRLIIILFAAASVGSLYLRSPASPSAIPVIPYCPSDELLGLRPGEGIALKLYVPCKDADRWRDREWRL